MTSLPNYRPKQLSLGPLEAEILDIIWEIGSATVKDVHDRILADPNRELAYTFVTTVLRRLTEKGWLACDKRERAYYAFADSLDLFSIDESSRLKPELISGF